jgi:hypothetical protein
MPMRVFAQPMVALTFGAFILCAETCLHLEDILHPASWVDLPWHDWLAGAFLVLSGVIGRRLYEAAAWGFMSSLLMGAFLGHWEDWNATPQPEDWISGRAFLTILAVLLVLSICGLVATLRTDRVQSFRA